MARLNKIVKQKLTEYFKTRVSMTDYNKGWLKGDCPSCGKEFKYGVHIANNRTNCFYCGYNKSAFDTMMDIESIETWSEAYKFIDQFDGMHFTEGSVLMDEQYSKNTERILPEGYKIITRGDSQLAKSARSYLKGRGFDIKKLARAGWGYGTQEPYFGYIIMPFYEKNKLTYFITRNFMSAGPKFNNPKAEDYGIGKNMLIYNMDCLEMYKTVYILESVTNAVTIGENAIAMDGKKISKYQWNILLKSQVERFIVILDPDAYREAVEFSMKLSMYKRVKLVRLKDGVDVNDIGRHKTLLEVYKTRYTDYNELLKIKLSL